MNASNSYPFFGHIGEGYNVFFGVLQGFSDWFRWGEVGQVGTCWSPQKSFLDGLSLPGRTGPSTEAGLSDLQGQPVFTAENSPQLPALTLKDRQAQGKDAGSQPETKAKGERSCSESGAPRCPEGWPWSQPL